MPRAKATDRLTIKGLSAEDLEWLKAESNRLGCDPENLVRMMIRQRSSAVVVPVGTMLTPQPRHNVLRDFYEKEEQRLAEINSTERDLPYSAAEAEANSYDTVPPDGAPGCEARTDSRRYHQEAPQAEPSLAEVMAQPPRLAMSNEAPAIPGVKSVNSWPVRPTPYDPIAAQRGGRGTQFQRRADIARRNVLPYPAGAYAAFSETEPISTGAGLIGERPFERFVTARR